MAEEERLLSKNHKKPSKRRASLMIAYGLELLVNAKKATNDTQENTLLKILEQLIITDGDDKTYLKRHVNQMSQMLNTSQAGPKDTYFSKLLNNLSQITPADIDHDLSEIKHTIEHTILEFISEMVVRDMIGIKPDLEKCFIEELKQCSSEVSKLVVQAQNIGLKPIKTMPSCLNPKIAIFRPNILYAGRQELLSVGKVEFKERPLDGLIYCDIDFTIENLVIEKQKGILTLSPDNNFVIFSQTSKESNKAFHNTQTLWQINYDFGDVKSGIFRTITFNPSYFDCQWFILGSCEQSLDMIGTQCSVKALPQSTHIAASRYVDFTHMNAIYDTSRQFIEKSFRDRNNILTTSDTE